MAKILIVEDDVAIRSVLTRLLRGSGYEVVAAGDGARGVGMAREEQPDLILMDLGLPILNGWQATARIKALPATAHIPIIVLTAYALAEDRERSMRAGCDDFETKPLDLTRLLTKIERWLARAPVTKDVA
jgi:two-component system cell cycle response regulator DivK